MRRVSVLLIILLSFPFFIVCEKVHAAAVPISRDEFSEFDREYFVELIKEGDNYAGIPGTNVWGEKFYKEKGVLYWTANFGAKGNNVIKFKLNSKNYVDWATITHSMTKPTKNSFQEYRVEVANSFLEVGAVWDALVEKIIRFYDDYGILGNALGNEFIAAFSKIQEQVEQGKAITPYDHTFSKYIKTETYDEEVEKTLNVRVYWSESVLFIAVTAK